MSSESENDIIDDTGCEHLFEPTYWDINYFHKIEIDNGEGLVDEEDEEEIKAKVKEIQRFKHFEESYDGSVKVVYPKDYMNEIDEYDEESSVYESDVSYLFIIVLTV